MLVISEEWMLRAGVRAELRERNIEALGVDSAKDAGRIIAEGEKPAAIVIDGNAKETLHPAVQQLVGRIPTVVIAPRTTTVALGSAAKALFRPVQVSEIVAAVLELVNRNGA